MLPKLDNQLISQWYLHSVRFVKTIFLVVVSFESNNLVFIKIFYNSFLHDFSNFYCVSQKYHTLFFETRGPETLENGGF